MTYPMIRMFLVALLLFGAAIAHANNGAEPKHRYQLLVGDAVLVPTNGMYRVSVGNARAIQAVPVDPSELLLIGEASGFSRC